MEVRTCYKTAKYDDCRSFYEGVLHWPVFKEWNRSPTNRGVVYSIEGALLELLSSSESAATKFDGSFYLYVETKELEALWNALEQAKCSPTKICSFEWGHRSFVTKDPAGFILKFFSKTTDRASSSA